MLNPECCYHIRIIFGCAHTANKMLCLVGSELALASMLSLQKARHWNVTARNKWTCINKCNGNAMVVHESTLRMWKWLLCESDYLNSEREKIWLANDSQQKYGSLSIVCWRGQRTLLGTTHANRAIHTHAASIMNTHIDAIGGLVSNPSDRETRGSRAHAAPLNLEVVTSSWAEPHIDKRDIGQLSNRKLIDPSESFSTSETRDK